MFILSEATISWRFYVLVMTIPHFLTFILTLFLDESPQYLIHKSENQKALNVLNKIAKRNRAEISGGILLRNSEPRYADSSAQKNADEFIENKPNNLITERLGFLTNVYHILKDPKLFRIIISIVFMGVAARFVGLGFRFVNTDFIYLQGEQGSYCQKPSQQSYLLDRQDYLRLFCLQIGGILALSFQIPFIKFSINLKIIGIICFGASFVLCTVLYFCPDLMIALVITFIVKSFVQIVNVSSWLNLADAIPIKTRSTMTAICGFLMSLSLPVTPYLIQIMSKNSNSYTTTLCCFVMLLGLLGAILVPRNIIKK